MDEEDLSPEMIEAGVTLAMIEAGVKVLHDSGAVENWLSYGDRMCVAEIYVAMLRAKE